jgi:hypothetical protein
MHAVVGPRSICTQRCVISRRVAHIRPHGDSINIRLRGRWIASAGGSRWNFKDEIHRLKRLEDHFDFFQSNVDVLTPADLSYLLEGLGSKFVPAFGTEGRAEAQKKLFNAVEFIQILKDVVWKIERFGPHDLTRCLAALHTIQWHDRQLFKIAEPLAIKHLSKVDSHELPTLVVSFVEVRCGSRFFYDEVVHHCMQVADGFTGTELAKLIHGFAHGPHKPNAFLLQITPL